MIEKAFPENFPHSGILTGGADGHAKQQKSRFPQRKIGTSFFAE